tara:strand:+ start:46 stop:567 length:522 start_codon:yes stop_codon:yes gene_type:complete
MKELLEAHHSNNGTYSSAVFSKCYLYRYALTQSDEISNRLLLFLLLNPSTANHLHSDATLSRCRKRAFLLGFKSFRICNLFAFRTKNPGLMKKYSDPIGPYNDYIIQTSLNEAALVICAWGNHGSHLNRAETVKNFLIHSKKKSFHFGLTKNNQPKHPLYLRYSQRPIKWLIK